MTTELHLSRTLSLPLEAVMKQHFIVGQSSSGKTNDAVVLVEEFAKAHQQFVVIDEPGVWWGLRSSGDGKHDGLAVILLGGEHGDMPLDPSSGVVVADFVVQSGRSFVLDLSLMTRGKWSAFMVDFCTRLYEAKATTKTPLHLVLDEADLFAPETPQEKTTGKALLEAIDNMARRGRSRGLRMTFVTQRPQVINKSIIAQSDVLHVFRLSHPLDRKALDSWVRGNATSVELAAFTDEIASLDTGHCFIWSPHWLKVFKRIHVRRRETFDSSTTPEVGVKAARPAKMAHVDLAGLKKTLAETLDTAKLEDPAMLRAQIAELKARLEDRRPVAFVPKAVKTAIFEALGGLRAEVRTLEKVSELIRMSVDEGVRPELATATSSRQTSPSLEAVKPGTTRAPAVPATSSADGVSGPAIKVLRAMARLHPEPTTPAQLAVFTGYPPNGSTLRGVFAELRKEGLAEHGKPYRLTTAGVKKAGPIDPLPTGRALVEYWAKELGGTAGGVLRAIFDAHPRELTKQDIERLLGYPADGSTLRGALAANRKFALVEKGSLRLGAPMVEAHARGSR